MPPSPLLKTGPHHDDTYADHHDDGDGLVMVDASMRHDKRSGFYVVDAATASARRPHHVADRLAQRRPRHTTTTAGGAADPHRQVRLRRERLRLRNLHVQQVRDAQRATAMDADAARRNALRDSLKAADRNRREILDRTTQACALQVSRAKEIAAAQQKKDEEALLARRQALEDRLSASEARRRAQQTVPRSRRLQPTEVAGGTAIDELSPIRNSAAASIQRWWRASTVLAIAREWENAGGLTLKKIVDGMSFDDFVKRIQSQEVIHGANSFVDLLRKLVPVAAAASASSPVTDKKKDDANARRGRSSKKSSSSSSSAKKVMWKNPSRVFLSAFMIVAHTSEIMPTVGAEEETVKRTASDLLAKFEVWVEKAAKGGFQDPLPTTLDLLASWTAYYAAFQAWKERDTKKIIEDLVSHWMELERLWISVRDQVDAETEWKPRIEQQQKVLLNRLNRFGEPALERLREARQQLVLPELITPDNMDVDQATDDVPVVTGRFARSPSPAPIAQDVSILSTSPQRFPSSKFLMRRPDSVVAGSSSPGSRRGSATSRSPARTESPGGMSISRPSTPTTTVSDADTAVANEKPTVPDLSGVASSFGSNLSNEQLAHELSLDPEFSLKKTVLSPLEEQVRAIARKAFFDGVRAAFAAGDYSVYVPDFIADIKKQLLSMVSETGKISAEIKEILDLDLLRQQISHKILNMKALLTYVITKMGQLCAPIRDAAVRAIIARVPSCENADILTSIFEDSLTLLEDMRLDLANHRLQSLRPHLRPIATDYERKKFSEALARGDATLERTRAWLTACVREKEGVARARNPENVEIPENRIRFTDIFHEAILSLVFSPSSTSSASEDTVPETIVMDYSRLRQFQEEGQRLTITAALLMLTQNTVPEIRGDRAAITSLKDRLMILLKDSEGLTVDNLSEQIIDSVSTAIRARRTAVNAAVGKEVLPTSSSSTSSSSPIQASSAYGTVLSKDREDLIRTMATKTISAKDPVFGLLRRRIQATVKAHAASGIFKREGLERAGLEVIRTELEAFSVRVATWVRFNGDVYSEWYDEILREVVA